MMMYAPHAQQPPRRPSALDWYAERDAEAAAAAARAANLKTQSLPAPAPAQVPYPRESILPPPPIYPEESAIPDPAAHPEDATASVPLPPAPDASFYRPPPPPMSSPQVMYPEMNPYRDMPSPSLSLYSTPSVYSAGASPLASPTFRPAPIRHAASSYQMQSQYQQVQAPHPLQKQRSAYQLQSHPHPQFQPQLPQQLPPHMQQHPSQQRLSPPPQMHGAIRVAKRPQDPPPRRRAAGPFAALQDFDTVLLIDDSEYMAPHWAATKRLVAQIAEVCVPHDRDGIDLFFMNHRPPGARLFKRGTEHSGYRHVRAVRGAGGGVPKPGEDSSNPTSVEAIVSRVRPKGPCMLGERIRQLLYWYMSNLGRHQAERGHDARAPAFPPKLNLVVLTAGVEGGREGAAASVVAKTARRLDELRAPPDQVGIQFLHVGANRSARREFARIDDELAPRKGVRDMTDTVAWDSVTAAEQGVGEGGLLMPEPVLRKAVLGGFSRVWDARNPAGGRSVSGP